MPPPRADIMANIMNIVVEAPPLNSTYSIGLIIMFSASLSIRETFNYPLIPRPHSPSITVIAAKK